MAARSDFWYRLGYALESARRGQARASLEALSTSLPASSRNDGPGRRSEPGGEPTDPDRGTASGGGDPEQGDGTGALDLLLAAGSGTVLSRILSMWPTQRRATVGRLVRAAAAGAGATLLREMLEPLRRGEVALPEWDESLGERLTAGAARGLVYGGVLDPRLPGPPAVRGVLYGAAEYLLSPWGGLRGMVGKHAPYARLPVVSSLLDDPEAGEEALLDHLVFGAALGLLYGDGGELDVRIGIDDDEA